jgi:dipeptidyl aminopeptidase/acylaminoacyl peptidase
VVLDERLRRAIEHAGEPADPSGVYEGLIRRRERRRIRRRVGSGLLALAVIAGTSAGVFALSKFFGGPDEDEVTPLVPVTPTGAENGLVAFTTGEVIVVQAADGSDRHEIHAPAPGLAWHIAWSPSGDRLALAIFTDPGRSLWVMNADGSNPVLIAEGSNVSRPSWHPDGEHLTYSLERDGMTEVHVTRSDGTDDRVVYSEAAPGTSAVFSATFSPDGSRILFDAGTDVGYDIFLMDADGSKVRQLTRTGSDYNPSWSPDGLRILFTREEAAGGSDIFVMDADGSNVRRLTDGGPDVNNLDAQFSPDGTAITYEASKNGGTGSVVVMNADGRHPRTLVPGEVLGFSWQPVPNATNEEPTPGPSNGEDLGLGFPVCNVTSVRGEFAPGVDGKAYVATKAGDTACPDPGDGLQVLAVDLTGDGLSDTSYGPLECEQWCTAYAVPDVDGDGTDELLVQNVEFSIVGLKLFDVQLGDGGAGLGPVTVAAPGYPQRGLEPGTEPQLWLGGDAFDVETLRCEDSPEGRVLIHTTATMDPPDSTDAVWRATETTYSLNDDVTASIVQVREFTEPVRPGPPSFQSGEMLCGSNLGPSQA